MSYYPTDIEQRLSVVHCIKKTKNIDAPVKVINHILDWHNCVIWHGGLLPANHSRLLAGFLFIHQGWIPKAMMQARTPPVCFCSRSISNNGFSSVNLKQELKLMSSRCIWNKICTFSRNTERFNLTKEACADFAKYFSTRFLIRAVPSPPNLCVCQKKVKK